MSKERWIRTTNTVNGRVYRGLAGRYGFITKSSKRNTGFTYVGETYHGGNRFFGNTVDEVKKQLNATGQTFEVPAETVNETA